MTDRPTTNPTTSKNPASKPNDDKKKHTEDLLDEALRETFPASDPPAMLEPGHLQPPPKEKKK